MIECTKEIRVSKECLFDITQDYSIRMAWDPFPESYSFLNGSKLERGLQLKVTDKTGRSMTVEYVSFRPPLVASVKMIDGPWYIKSFAGSWSFRKLSENRTVAIFKYNIVGYPKIIGNIVRFVFKRNVQKRLLALKQYAESKI